MKSTIIRYLIIFCVLVLFIKITSNNDLKAQNSGTIYEAPMGDDNLFGPYELMEITEVHPMDGGYVSGTTFNIRALMTPSNVWEAKGGTVEMYLDGTALRAEAMKDEISRWWITARVENLTDNKQHDVRVKAFSRNGGLMAEKQWKFKRGQDQYRPIIENFWAETPSGKLPLYDGMVVIYPMDWTGLGAKICDPWSDESFQCDDLSMKKPPEEKNYKDWDEQTWEKWKEAEGDIDYYPQNVTGIDPEGILVDGLERLVYMKNQKNDVYGAVINPDDLNKMVTSDYLSFTLNLRALDLAGNVSWRRITFHLMRKCPYISIKTPENDSLYGYQDAKSLKAEFKTYEFGEGLAALDPDWIEVSLGNTILTDSYRLRPGVYDIGRLIPKGTAPYTFKVRVRDKAKRIFEESVTFMVDSNPPRAAWLNPAQGLISREPIHEITAEIHEDVNIGDTYSNISVSVDGGKEYYSYDPKTRILTISELELGDGAHNVIIHLRDKAGNYSDNRLDFSVDAAGPNIRFIAPARDDDSVPPDSPLIVILEDTVSGVARDSVQVFLDEQIVKSPLISDLGADGRLQVTIMNHDLADGRHKLRVHCTDKGANAANAAVDFSVSSTADGAVVVTEIAPKMINPEADETVSVSYYLPFAGDVSITLVPFLKSATDSGLIYMPGYQPAGYQETSSESDLITITPGSEIHAGINSFTWNGLDAQGGETPPNAYEIRIKVAAPDGRKAENERTMNNSWMDSLPAEADPELDLVRMARFRYRVKEWGYILCKFTVPGNSIGVGAPIRESDRVFRGPGEYTDDILLRRDDGIDYMLQQEISAALEIKDIPADSIIVQYPRPEIRGLTIEPGKVEIGSDGEVKAAFELSLPARVRALVVDDYKQRTAVVYQSAGFLGSGRHEFGFRAENPGDINIGMTMPYVVVVEAVDERGQKALRSAAGYELVNGKTE